MPSVSVFAFYAALIALAALLAAELSGYAIEALTSAGMTL